MQRRTQLYFLLLALVVGLVAAMTTMSGQDKKAKTASQREEATVVQEGALTPKQKKHSRLFEIPGETKLKDRAPNSKEVEAGQDVPLRISRYSNPDEYLRDLACKSDAVIEGTVKSKASQLTEKGTNIFTDYELTVTKVLKNNDRAPIQSNSDVTITRIGGAVSLNGRVLRAVYGSQPSLRAEKSYILFLKFIPETGAYTSVGISGENSFRVEGDRVTQLSEEPQPLGGNSESVDATVFLNQIQTALNNPCN
jgi:hypothetical protein